jgi:asparagine synthetase B (glutamine-hydrolysing)
MALGALAVALTKSGRGDAGVVRRMLGASPHRGSGHDVGVFGNCALGVSTQDVTADATIYIGHGLAAAFAGALDNLSELAKELHASPAPVPAEIVVEAFRVWGEDAPNRMRGAFGAVLTDGRDVWCFQDHVAYGHVFYRDEPRMFYAATEPKQVLAGAGIAKEPDLEVLERLFYADLDWGGIDRELPCALKGVRRLPKASVVSTAGGRLQGRRYWNPEGLIETGRFSPLELQHRFDELMRQAVARTMTGDDVVSLSGGVDSPAVAAFAAAAQDRTRPVGALTGVYPAYPTVDETRYVELVAAQLSMPLDTFMPVARPLDDIDEWVRVLDGPAPVLPPAQSAEHYRQARKLGYRTMLTGEHAELVFDQHRYLVSHLLWRGRLPAAWSYLRKQRAQGRRYKSIAIELASAVLPRPGRVLYWRYGPSANRGILPGWLDERRVTGAELGVLPRSRDRWQEIQLMPAQGPGLASEPDDICQAVCGVTARRPWADVDLYEFFLSLPAEVKFPYPRAAGKALVRELLRGKVPDPILDRTDKTYFNDFFMDRIDYDTFRRLLVKPNYRINGVRYDVLTERLERGDFSLGEYKWALDLAKTHAFLSQW